MPAISAAAKLLVPNSVHKLFHTICTILGEMTDAGKIMHHDILGIIRETLGGH